MWFQSLQHLKHPTIHILYPKSSPMSAALKKFQIARTCRVFQSLCHLCKSNQRSILHICIIYVVYCIPTRTGERRKHSLYPAKWIVHSMTPTAGRTLSNKSERSWIVNIVIKSQNHSFSQPRSHRVRYKIVKHWVIEPGQNTLGSILISVILWLTRLIRYASELIWFL